MAFCCVQTGISSRSLLPVYLNRYQASKWLIELIIVYPKDRLVGNGDIRVNKIILAMLLGGKGMRLVKRRGW